MYISKHATKAISELTLALKVSAKRYGTHERGTVEWHKEWDNAEYAQKAILAILGDAYEYERLQEMACFNEVAQYYFEHYASVYYKGNK